MRIFRDPVKANTNTPPVLSETQETVPVLKKVWLSVFKTTKSLFQYQAEPIENLRNRVHPLNRNLSCFLKKLIGPISAESIQTNIIASAGTSLSGLDSHKIEELLERTFLLIFDKISKMNDLEPITDLLEHFEELTRLPVITKKELNDKKNEIKSTKTAIKEAKRNLRQQTENEEPTRAIHAEIEELKSEIKNTSKKLLPARHKELRRQLGEKRRNLYINTRTRNADLI